MDKAISPQSVGLGGDGDEIAAIEEVESEFSVKLDYTDAGDWSNVGHVYAALEKALPADEFGKPDTWNRFAKAICRQTGITPSSIGLESELLCESRIWIHVAHGSALLWIAIALAIVLSIAGMLL